MGTAQWLVLAVAALRLIELAYAARNTRRLRARGGREVGARHYPLLVGLHAAWLATIFATVSRDTPPSLPLAGVFAALLAARAWTIASLGPYWTTRVITLPDERLVRRGPYRFLRHPNYLIVAGEIAVLPLMFGAWRLALAFSALNAAALWHRIRVEDQALAPRRSRAAPGGSVDEEQEP
jgi:methyltransferase